MILVPQKISYHVSIPFDAISIFLQQWIYYYDYHTILYNIFKIIFVQASQGCWQNVKTLMRPFEINIVTINICLNIIRMLVICYYKILFKKHAYNLLKMFEKCLCLPGSPRWTFGRAAIPEPTASLTTTVELFHIMTFSQRPS